MLHRYFGAPEFVRNISFEEYRCKEKGELFRGRKPRRYLDICMDLWLKKPRYEKALEIHESRLFDVILESDTERASDNKERIEEISEDWHRTIADNQRRILGGRAIYELAPEFFEDEELF